MCGFKGKHLVINSSYHTYISFILDSLSYNITYPSWLSMSYSYEYFTLSMWSYHWLSRYPFTLVSLQEWMYNSPQHISQCYYSYCFEKWNTCSEGGFPPFPSPNPTTSGYPYHQIWLPCFDGCCYCLSNSHKYGATNINDDIACNDDGYSKEDMIIC